MTTSDATLIQDDDHTWRGLLVPGYVTAVLVPFVGIVIGFIIIAKRGGKPGTGHGIGMIVVAIVFVTIAVAVLMGSSAEGTSPQAQQYQLVPCATHPEAIGC